MSTVQCRAHYWSSIGSRNPLLTCFPPREYRWEDLLLRNRVKIKWRDSILDLYIGMSRIPQMMSTTVSSSTCPVSGRVGGNFASSLSTSFGHSFNIPRLRYKPRACNKVTASNSLIITSYEFYCVTTV